MKRNTDRLVYGYIRFQQTVGVSTEVYRKELQVQSRELMAPDFSSMIQVHGNQIAEAKPGFVHPDTDGLVTDQLGLMLYGCFADCLPIIIWDEDKPLIGLAHAGWQGTAGKISIKLVEKLIEMGGTKLSAWIGPGICAKHYQVSAGFETQVKPLNLKAMINLPDDHFFDLKLENRTQLETYLKPETIEVSQICTFEDPNYYSYRRDKSERGRNLAYLMLK